MDELEDIQTKLAMFEPEKMIWEAEDLTKITPSSFNSDTNATNLSDCFISVSGQSVFDILFRILEFCIRRKINVKIQSKNDFLK